MAKYKIPKKNGGYWGELEVKAGRTYKEKAEIAIGGAIDFLIAACEVVENQLLWELTASLSKPVRRLLYLYFNMIEVKAIGEPGQEAVGTILSVVKGVREGFLDEQGSVLIKAADPDLVGPSMSGYVQSHFKGMGHIHLQLGKMIPQELSCGAPYFALLLFHEATHRFCKTVDSPVSIPGQAKKLAYAHSTKSDILGDFETAPDKKTFRTQNVGNLFNYIKTKDALNNADSISWFLTNMVNSYATTLKKPKLFKGIWNNFKTTAADFEDVQREVLPEKMLAVDDFVTFFKVN